MLETDAKELSPDSLLGTEESSKAPPPPVPITKPRSTSSHRCRGHLVACLPLDILEQHSPLPWFVVNGRCHTLSGRETRTMLHPLHMYTCFCSSN